MKYSTVLILGFLIFMQPCICQTRAKITDVDYHLEGNIIVVNYTITGSLPGERLSIELKFLNEDNKPFIPVTATGDIGAGISGDGIKKIIWDVVKDDINFSGKLKAVVTISSSRLVTGGPANALLSVAVPGLGGYFVEKNKIRPVATAVTTLGLLGYGFSQKHKSNKYYDEYKASIEPTEIESLYDMANSAHHRYFVATRIAAGIWAFDIVWTVIKGFQNKKAIQSYDGRFNGDGLRLEYARNGLQLKYSISF
jgi:hypothetical protein